MVWNYVSLFSNYMIPNPNWGLYGHNLRFFRENGVISVFNQSGGGMTGDFAPLRAYVNSKLLWDPDLDEWTLIREFVENYYGKAAAPFIMQYLGMMKIDYNKQKAGFCRRVLCRTRQMLLLLRSDRKRSGFPDRRQDALSCSSGYCQVSFTLCSR